MGAKYIAGPFYRHDPDNRLLWKRLLLKMYFGAIQVLSALIHLLLCRLFGIDAATSLITSVAALYGPPFVVSIGNVCGDKETTAGGMICSMLGLAAGNFLGIGIGSALMHLL